MKSSREIVGQTHDGKDIEALTLVNSTGFSVTVLTLGATLQRLMAADRNGRFDDIVLGHDDAESYWRTPGYQGVTVGRFANRIRDGVFKLDDTPFSLATNNGKNHLHGGEDGFDRRLWTIDSIDPSSASVTLSLVTPDEDEGYPGELSVLSRWTLDDDDTLTIAFEATTTKPTIVNLTNHAFFNLCGTSSQRPATEHLLTLFADTYTPVDAGQIPTGEIASVEGTPFDFRSPRKIADSLMAADGNEQICIGQGYDHNMVIRGERGVMRPAARLHDPVSGRVLDVSTTEPGLQFYSGNFLDGSLIGKGGRPMQQGDGICLEPQTFPDAPNQPGFPSARLDPGQTYRHTIRFRCSASE